ncbi:two-component system nitrogen regulation sensor histidine kinase NtrY [Brevundimonas nasdae]|uniref:sensor histidine kinase NtrY-like n=1 Tax=Brevundimonas nasdae TaxID=172043 RepID=UPI001913493C|nr:PAS domain-containing sensor histidine kinase [Brevundimonas nasdae]MBK6024200.1 PAS domain-containing sensor histidine kinase [Brevundimonas nasdae]MDQ0450855.1 two-component system nitrogen regulation sensor histidine kinase NtrY [Brevundimonas nasdae]
MTDTPPPVSSLPDLVSDDESFWGRLQGERARALFGLAYVIAVVITAATIWLVAVAPSAISGGEGSIGSQLVLYVLIGNLFLISGLAFLVGRRVFALARSTNEAGSRLHLRFVTLFSMVAVIPSVLIALVFGMLVTRGVDQWFSQNVQASVENGAIVGRAYIDDVSGTMDSDLVIIADQLTGARGLFDNRIRFNDALQQIGDIFGYPAVYILNSKGEVLARGESAKAPPYLAPPRSELEAAAEGGKPPQQVTEHPDAVRSIIALPAYGDAYLYLVRPLQEGLVARMNASSQSIVAYRDAQESRARIQSAFILSYLETALLVLVGAVWLGMSAASSISAPIGRLVKAAGQVAGGDFTARVDSHGAPAEVATLSEAFNRMTSDLQAQQTALKDASEEAQDRSKFIETVLSGVSAGVIGLDRLGRVSAINESALQLLHIEEAEVLGHELGGLSPELSDLVRRAEAHIEEDIDVSRAGETLRLRVRIEGGLGGEMVLTFDDITRLVTAQRNAAWRDVARRIAHEIKNPLTPIQLSAERLKRKYRSRIGEDVEIFDRCTDTIIRQVGDIGRMVDEFSSFARMPAPRFAQANPAEMLREAVFAQRVAAPDIVVSMVDPLPMATQTCDGRMVGQALLNILKNAGEAVAARRLADGVPAASDLPGVITSLTITDGIATFAVEDDGVGLPARDRDRLTEPYVTTREKGTGLGLAIVKRICEDHGGELKLADAETLRGARVCLIFPLNPPGKNGDASERKLLNVAAE